MIYDLSKNSTLLSTFIGELRDITIQKDSMRFRRNLERVGEVIAYEISKHLDYETQNIETPLGTAPTSVLKNQPVLATILRAGLGMHQGLLNYFDHSESAFISAYRKHTTAENFEVYVEYMASPKIDNKTVIISDPMLASGTSMQMVYEALLKQGNPKRIIVASTIASPEALEHLQAHLPKNTFYYIGAIDQELTAESYIVPGLGDAGDLAFGEKF